MIATGKIDVNISVNCEPVSEAVVATGWIVVVICEPVSEAVVLVGY